MADVWYMPIPVCPVHGEMKRRTVDGGNGYNATLWVCPGFDGEGCDYRPGDLEWQPLGTTARMPVIHFTLEPE